MLLESADFFALNYAHLANTIEFFIYDGNLQDFSFQLLILEINVFRYRITNFEINLKTM